MIYFLKGITVLILFLWVEQCNAQSQVLNLGDVVIVGYNFKDPDEFSLLPLVDLQAGTQFCITDAGWDAQASSLKKGEGLITYTVPPGGKKAGQQIVYPYEPGFQTQGMNGFFGLAVAGDQLLVFQGDVNAPSFIFGINDFNGNWQSETDVVTNQTSHLPSTLIMGSTALALNNLKQAHFDCAYLQVDKVSLLKDLSNPANWIHVEDRVALPIQACNFISLPLVFFDWNYEFVNQHQIRLTLKNTQANNQDVVWISKGTTNEEQLTCVVENGNYTCSLPTFLQHNFLLKPCLRNRNNNYCGAYRFIQSVPKSVFFYTQSEIGGAIAVTYEEENELDSSGKYYLFDLLGRSVVQGKLSTYFVIGNLKQGLYILKVQNGKVWKELKVWVMN